MFTFKETVKQSYEQRIKDFELHLEKKKDIQNRNQKALDTLKRLEPTPAISEAKRILNENIKETYEDIQEIIYRYEILMSHSGAMQAAGAMLEIKPIYMLLEHDGEYAPYERPMLAKLSTKHMVYLPVHNVHITEEQKELLEFFGYLTVNERLYVYHEDIRKLQADKGKAISDLLKERLDELIADIEVNISELSVLS